MTELKLSRPIAFFDIESTGLDIINDRIVELSILKIFPDQRRETKYYLLNPQIQIKTEAAAVHGYTNDKVKDCPTLESVAGEINEFLKDTDLAGFNSNRFDIPMLVEEMLRYGYDLKVEDKNNVDVQTIFHMMEKRTLEAAYQYYCDKTLINAHSAEADTLATYEVLLAQIERYDEVENDVESLSKKFSNTSQFVDNAKRIKLVDGQYYLNFGKFKDKTIEQIHQANPGYFKWMVNADFGRHTIAKLKEICRMKGVAV